jgi:hypothetical protein
MSNKYQGDSKVDERRTPKDKSEMIQPESHSQDSDRHRKAQHPKSDK